MSQNAIETPPSLPDVLAQNITCIKKGECELDLPSSFSFGPRENCRRPSHVPAPPSSPPKTARTGSPTKRPTAPPVSDAIRDQRLTPSHSSTSFTSESLSFLLDISFPILDNFYPEKAPGGHAATVQAGLEQKRDREMGVVKIVDAESGSYRAPAMITSLATSIEIKKLLPPGGTKWLFMRAQAKEIKDGRLSVEVMMFDEGMELVALSQQLCPIIDLSRVMANKQKL
ncbi:hypothetical protein ACHAO8_003751 [Botrytis cinerea]